MNREKLIKEMEKWAAESCGDCEANPQVGFDCSISGGCRVKERLESKYLPFAEEAIFGRKLIFGDHDAS